MTRVMKTVSGNIQINFFSFILVPLLCHCKNDKSTQYENHYCLIFLQYLRYVMVLCVPYLTYNLLQFYFITSKCIFIFIFSDSDPNLYLYTYKCKINDKLKCACQLVKMTFQNILFVFSSHISVGVHTSHGSPVLLLVSFERIIIKTIFQQTKKHFLIAYSHLPLSEQLNKRIPKTRIYCFSWW